MHYVRAATLSGFQELIHSLNLDIDTLLGAVALDPSCLNPNAGDQYLELRKLENLYSLAEQQSGRSDLAAHLGRQQQLSPLLGILGFVMLQSKNVGEALKQLQHYFSFQLQGAFLQIEFQGLYVALSLIIKDAYQLPSTRHTAEFAMAAGISILNSLCGDDWTPTRVEFMHNNPDPKRLMQALYLSKVQFNQERNAIVFPALHLLKPISTKNSQLSLIVKKNLEFLEQRYTNDFPSQVEQLIYQALSSGNCSIHHVCQYLNTNRRTLARHLQKSNTSYNLLLEKVRKNMAQNLLKQSSISLTNISVLLGYSEPSAFSRAFKKWFGTSPRLWRNST